MGYFSKSLREKRKVARITRRAELKRIQSQAAFTERKKQIAETATFREAKRGKMERAGGGGVVGEFMRGFKSPTTRMATPTTTMGKKGKKGKRRVRIPQQPKKPRQSISEFMGDRFKGGF